jgi:hypothetical protein
MVGPAVSAGYRGSGPLVTRARQVEVGGGLFGELRCAF